MSLNRFDPQTLASLSSVALRSRHLVEGLRPGEHRGGRQGLAVEFSQLRPYSQGDELKRIDWKVFGRTDKLNVRQYQEEVELNVYLVLDATSSMSYSGSAVRNKKPGLSKFEYASLLAALNGYLTLRQADTVQLATVGRALKVDSAFRSVGQWTAFLDSLDQNCVQNRLPNGESPLAATLLELLSIWKAHGLFIIFSDLFDDWEPLSAALKRIRLAGHDCCVYHVVDRDELDFPFQQRTRFDFLETDSSSNWLGFGSGFGLSHRAERTKTSSPPYLEGETSALRDAYRTEIQQYLAEVSQTCLNNEIDYRLAVTDRPLDEPIRRFNVYTQESGLAAGGSA